MSEISNLYNINGNEHKVVARLSRIKQGPGDLPGAGRLFHLVKANDVGVTVIKPMTGYIFVNRFYRHKSGLHKR